MPRRLIGGFSMREFWNSEITAKSYEKLQQMKGETDFVLIGGWAIYLHTHAYKSKDIDIVVGYDELIRLKQTYKLSKNEFLKKYEIKLDFFDIDIYLPAFSKLAVPPEELLKHFDTIGGIKVAPLPLLLLLKQQAWLDRKGSIKGKKDALDIALLALSPEFEIAEYAKKAKEFGHSDYPEKLHDVLMELSDADLPYLGIGRTEFLKKRKGLVAALRAYP